MQRQEAIAWENAFRGTWMGFVGDDWVATVEKVGKLWHWEMQHPDGRLFQPPKGEAPRRVLACREADSYWGDHLALSGRGHLLRWEHPWPDTWLGHNEDKLVAFVSRSPQPPGEFSSMLNTKGIGIRSERTFEPHLTEYASQGRDFIEHCCKLWANASLRMSAAPGSISNTIIKG